ncbi:TonB-dependent receptor [Cellulophaga lytica]|uniref:TonB-dependent receptor plug n=1 Tax=Cellulophaga lytica (strain ATCC 23178 / DSM 7489 / JCM 8516 / NBRC 14961 / NCIMB 1423 / VKM B-1433 / Cy l20) TaxID=867900 RepID=F0RHL1_CELLC|nr:TonB-dependent receptor [Cellulophaga lytica]ADY30277.1 TonB-dependent receptor plug [Cellulophaga lytica DSM 7489]WQG78789.1 TonB-dependent receptor [Cellulophaga lytica]
MYFKNIPFKLKTILFFVLSAIFCQTVQPNNGVYKKQNITVNYKNTNLVTLLKEVSNQTSYNFSYGEDIIKDKNKYTVSYQNISLESALKDLSKKANFSYKITNKIVLIKKKATTITTSNVQKEITGTVVDENGDPLPGATIHEVGTPNGVTTNFDGEYTITATTGSVLKFSYMGYKSKELKVTQSVVNVQLELDAAELNEVVVVGYGSQTKADVTGAVTQLKESSFRQGINTSPDALLQGKVAGVRVVNASGEPGAGINVTIRGVGSIRSGSSPLFVVDGVPLTNDNVSPSGSNVGFGASSAKNPLNFLNTSDIESINVLKDASASAIYGARGSNGVVIITTKKGKAGKGSLSLDSYIGISTVANKIDLLDANEYRNALTDPTFDHGSSTDWQDVIYRTAITKNNVLSYSKASESGNYYVSLGNIDQEGIVNNSEFSRTSGRINVEESFLDNKRLKLKVNLTASETKDNGVPTSDDGGSNGQLIIHTLMANPTRPVFGEDGSYTNFNMNAHYNPAYLLSIYEDETRTLRVLGNIEASLRIFNGLEYKLNYGVDKSVAERNTTVYPNLTDLNPIGMYVQNNLESQSSLLEHYLTFNTTIADKHKLEVLGGFSYQKFERSGTSFNYDNLPEKGTGVKPVYNPTSNNSQIDINGFAQENELQSYFGRLNYSYDSKYLLTASMRADGSTRFGKNNKYGYFPSFALGWNISKEDFLINSNVDNLKLRASWGQTGNQEVQNKITQASYAISGADGYYLYDDQTLTNGVSVLRTPNPDLKWEVVTQYNIGADFSLWNRKLYGSLDYFKKTTTDAILNIPSQVLSPTNNIWVNIDGEIVNNGLEFMLGSNIVSTEDFNWDVDINGATLKNEIKNLPVSEILSGTISGPGQSGVLANIYKSGYAAGSFYLLDHIGFNENGEDIYRDVNNDGNITGDDRIIIEGALPKFSYGFNSQMNYKNFDFSFSIIGQAGGYLVNNTGLNALNINNLASDRNVSKKYYESGANQENSPQLSTLYLEKSDFIRLNTARLGYNLKLNNVSWLNGVNFYVTGQNLLTITNYSGYDPLINSPKADGGNQSLGIDYSSYPGSKTFILGAILKF